MTSLSNPNADYHLVIISCTAPSGIPQRLTVDALTAFKVGLSWERVSCLDRNSEITGYRISYKRPPPSTTTQSNSNNDDSSSSSRVARRQVLDYEEVVNITGIESLHRQFTASGLLPQTNYTFSVEAVNAEEEVGPSTTITATTGIPEGTYTYLTPVGKTLHTSFT